MKKDVGIATKIKRGGFTMIELVVVIIVLAVMGYVTFQAVSGFSKKADVNNGVTKELQMIYQATQEFKGMVSPDGTYKGVEGNLSAFLPTDYKVNSADNTGNAAWIKKYDINSSAISGATGVAYRVGPSNNGLAVDINISYNGTDEQIKKLLETATLGFFNKLGKGTVVNTTANDGNLSITNIN